MPCLTLVLRNGGRVPVVLAAVAICLAAPPARAGGADAALISAVNSITTDELDDYVQTLANDTFEGRAAGTRGGRAAAIYLVQRLEKFGLEEAGTRGYYQTFHGNWNNLLGKIEGSDPDLKDEVIMIGAHYDHVGYGNAQNSYGPWGNIHNGADDNASGTAAVLEVAEAMKLLRPRRTILFALWDSEENGLLGSKHWVAQPTVPLSKIKLYFNLDMVGRLRNETIDVFGTRTSTGLRHLVAEHNRDSDLGMNFTWELKADSDHYSFLQHDIPILMYHTGLHKDYHRPSDDADKINYQGIQKIARLMLRSAAAAANQDEAPAFRTASRRENPAVQRRSWKAPPPLPGRLGVSWEGRDVTDKGAPVTSVRRGSAAERAGIRRGDRIVSFAGRKITDDVQFKQVVLQAPAETTARIVRAGQEEPQQVAVALSGSPVRVGIAWRADEAEPTGVILVRVVDASPAQQAGLAVGDRVIRLGGQLVSSSEEFERRVAELSGPVELEFERAGRIRTRTVDFGPLPDAP